MEIDRLCKSETKDNRVPCKFFSKKGGCRHSSTCMFSHETLELERQKDKELTRRKSPKVKKNYRLNVFPTQKF